MTKATALPTSTGEGAGTAPILTISDLSLSFGGTQALQGVTFEGRAGQILGLIGPNGAGKTTLLNCVCGYYRQDKGVIRLSGRELGRMRTSDIARLGVARTFQAPQLSPDLTVLQNVLLGRHRHMRLGAWTAALRLPGTGYKERHEVSVCEDILDFLGLGDYADRPISELSFAQQKVVEIGRAMATEPKLLLLDEPGSGMTAAEKSQVVQLIKRLRDESGVTPVIVEHDLRMLTQLCERLVVLNFGSVLTEGPPGEVLQDERVVSAYVGDQ